MTLSARLAMARAKLSLKQEEMSATTGIPIDSYKKYEGGKSQPGAEALEKLVRSGINANWLLTGEGPMLLGELGYAPAPPVNVALLAAILRGTLLGIPKAPPEIIAEDVAEYYAKVTAQAEANEA